MDVKKKRHVDLFHAVETSGRNHSRDDVGERSGGKLTRHTHLSVNWNNITRVLGGYMLMRSLQ